MSVTTDPPNSAGNDQKSLLTLSFALNVCGIYACFMSCSLLHESLYSSHQDLSPWFVNSVEAGLNVLVATAGVLFWEGVQPPLPQGTMASTGGLAVFSKYLVSKSRLWGVPGPVMTLVKTARPLPVMLGQCFVAGTIYSPREYVQYSLIVMASVLVGSARSPLASDGFSLPGVLCLVLSCVCDGYVGGRQKALKASLPAKRRPLGAFEMQLYTNLYMLLTALSLLSLLSLPSLLGFAGPSSGGLLPSRDAVVGRVLPYAACSAVGQVFVFACMAQTDPLVLSMVTSSRKLVSVVVTLVVFGYEVNATCLAGLALAVWGFGMILADEVKRLRNAKRKEQNKCD